MRHGWLHIGWMLMPALTAPSINKAAAEPLSIDQPSTRPSNPTTQPATDEGDKDVEDPQAATKDRTFPKSKSPSTNRRPDRPSYVRTLGDRLGDPNLNWLELGLEQRTRFEIRDDFFPASLESDDRFMMRSRAYLGVREILDPLRFGFEFQDSRRLGSHLAENTRDINEAEILQAFAELYFEDALGDGQPHSLRAGRMSFDAVDRRLFARNGFRNTTNAFDGFRIRLGDAGTVWELDMFAFQPVARQVRQFDHPDEERWLYGVNGYWRGWSPHITLEPYYFFLDEGFKGPGTTDREIHTLGLHGFGMIGETGFDYDFNAAFQFGHRGQDHRAFAVHGELGYTFDHDWQPRVAVMCKYASGDTDPNDRLDERFDSLFGASHNFYGHSDLFTWQNTINPALYWSLHPTGRLRLEGFYRTYWLAADRDAFIRAGIVDPTGRSDSFVGQEIDLRLRYKISDHADLDMGYAYFIPGDFPKNASPSTDDSDFFYVQVRVKF